MIAFFSPLAWVWSMTRVTQQTLQHNCALEVYHAEIKPVYQMLSSEDNKKNSRFILSFFIVVIFQMENT